MRHGARADGPGGDRGPERAAGRHSRGAGRRPAAGGLLGLPALEDDVWVDIAGAAAVGGVHPRTITGWLSRGRPATRPFPAARRYMYRLYWPLSQVEELRLRGERRAARRAEAEVAPSPSPARLAVGGSDP